MTGEKLKEIRLKNGLTLAQMSDILGIYASNLCTMEGKPKIPSYIEKNVIKSIKLGELKDANNNE